MKVSHKKTRPASEKRGAAIGKENYIIKSARLRKLSRALPPKLRPANAEEEAHFLALYDKIAHIVNAYARREARKAINLIGRF